MIAEEHLISLARQVALMSYSPYSGYAVGSALETEDGISIVGTNVENGSYGLTVCAERNAVSAMICSGARRWKRIVVATRDGSPPCGACLQVLAEFAESEHAKIILVSPDAVVARLTLHDLFPLRFQFEESTERKRE